ncbi:alpha/beta fold hydrolase [Jatrophihabitans sp. YIM 134969]
MTLIDVGGDADGPNTLRYRLLGSPVRGERAAVVLVASAATPHRTPEQDAEWLGRSEVPTVLFHRRGAVGSAPLREHHDDRFLADDLDVVVTALGIERCVLVGYGVAARDAITFAVAHGAGRVVGIAADLAEECRRSVEGLRPGDRPRRTPGRPHAGPACGVTLDGLPDVDPVPCVVLHACGRSDQAFPARIRVLGDLLASTSAVTAR